MPFVTFVYGAGSIGWVPRLYLPEKGSLAEGNFVELPALEGQSPRQAGSIVHWTMLALALVSEGFTRVCKKRPSIKKCDCQQC